MRMTLGVLLICAAFLTFLVGGLTGLVISGEDNWNTFKWSLTLGTALGISGISLVFWAAKTGGRMPIYWVLPAVPAALTIFGGAGTMLEGDIRSGASWLLFGITLAGVAWRLYRSKATPEVFRPSLPTEAPPPLRSEPPPLSNGPPPLLKGPPPLPPE